MRKTVLFTALLLVLPVASAVTDYDVQIDDGRAVINATIELYASSADEPVNYWTASWTPPSGARILSIEDSLGPINDYTYENGVLRFETNHFSQPQDKAVVDIEMVVENVVTERYGKLDLLLLRLSGYSDKRGDVPDEETRVQITTREKIRSESHTPGFRYSLEQRQATYVGEGPINVHLAVSDAGEEYNHFVLYGAGNLSNADNAYGLVPAVMGFLPDVNRHPVIVLSDSVYDREVDEWSAGQYRTGGLIFMRVSAMGEDDTAAILLHELSHAFNEHALRWNTAETAWFDEGTSKYVEYLYRHRKGLKQAELFGDPVTWTAPCETRGGTCRYTLPPRGEEDTLWDYYVNGDDFMSTWQPSTAATTERRTFGYAFSELLVRRYVLEHGNSGLHAAYEDLLDIEFEDGTISDAQGATDRMLGVLGTEFTPCKRAQRTAFEECLEDVNTADPSVPSTFTAESRTMNISITPIQRPSPPPSSLSEDGARFLQEQLDSADTGKLVDQLVQTMKKLFNTVLATVQQVLR